MEMQIAPLATEELQKAEVILLVYKFIRCLLHFTYLQGVMEKTLGFQMCHVKTTTPR